MSATNVGSLIAHLNRLLKEGKIRSDYHVAVWVRDNLGHGEAKDISLWPKADIDQNEEFIAFELN